MMLEILEKLISCKSVSPAEAGSIYYLEKLLKENGFSCYVKTFGEGEELTTNLYAENNGTGNNICFAGHVDVVPPGEISLWDSDPFKMEIRDGCIYGRGTVDMKAAVAAFVKASIDYSKKEKGKVSLLLTSDEEASGKYGTKKMLEWMQENGHKIDFAIIGEPTSSEKIGDIIKIGRRGGVNFDLTIFGKQGHVAYPEFADNPIDKLVRIVNKLIKLKLDNGNEFFQPSNLELTSIDTGNNTRNIIPYSISAKFNLRFNNERNLEDIISEIKSIIEKYCDNYKFKYDNSAEPFLSKITPFSEEFRKIVSRICNVETAFSTSGGTSDARFIKNYCPLLEFGLLNKTAHQINEHTEIRHLQNLYDVYYDAIKSYHLVDSD